MRIIDVNFSDSLKEYQDLVGNRKSEYILNVQKIIREKIGEDFIVPNTIQAFLLNYEVKKILDKIFNSKNQRYYQILYLNQKLGLSNVLNTIQFLSSSYSDIVFVYSILDRELQYDDELFKSHKVKMKILSPRIKKEEV